MSCPLLLLLLLLLSFLGYLAVAPAASCLQLVLPLLVLPLTGQSLLFQARAAACLVAYHVQHIPSHPTPAGVMSMKIGERCKLTCPPDYAYGARWVPPPPACLLALLQLVVWGPPAVERPPTFGRPRAGSNLWFGDRTQLGVKTANFWQADGRQQLVYCRGTHHYLLSADGVLCACNMPTACCLCADLCRGAGGVIPPNATLGG